AEAAEKGHDSEALRVENEALYRREHAESRWAHFINMALGSWLMVQAPLIQLNEPLLGWSEFVLGALVVVFAALSLSWQMNFARCACDGLGGLIMAAPFVFWTESAAAYLSDTLVGGLIFGLAVATKPEPGTS